MKFLFLPLLACLFAASASASPHDVFGTWMSEAKDGHIKIIDCGDGTPCGYLVWHEPSKTESTVDYRNKDEALRTRPLIGVPIIWGFEQTKTGWRNGKIYNPEDGNTFASHMKIYAPNKLKVKGCLAIICITNTWSQLSIEQEAVLNTPASNPSK